MSAASDAAARVLDAVEALRAPLIDEVAKVVAIPSVGGTDAENDGQAHMAALMARRAGGGPLEHRPRGHHQPSRLSRHGGSPP